MPAGTPPARIAPTSASDPLGPVVADDRRRRRRAARPSLMKPRATRRACSRYSRQLVACHWPSRLAFSAGRSARAAAVASRRSETRVVMGSSRCCRGPGKGLRMGPGAAISRAQVLGVREGGSTGAGHRRKLAVTRRRDDAGVGWRVVATEDRQYPACDWGTEEMMAAGNPVRTRQAAGRGGTVKAPAGSPQPAAPRRSASRPSRKTWPTAHRR